MMGHADFYITVNSGNQREGRTGESIRDESKCEQRKQDVPRRFQKTNSAGRLESDLTEAGIGIRIFASRRPAVRRSPQSTAALIHP
jgi:hypothetical protein